MAKGEGAQKRPERRRCHHPVPEHRRRLPRAQHIGVVDVAGTAHHGVDQGEDLAPRHRTADAAAETNGDIDEALEIEPGDQGGDQEQAGIGHQVGLVEGHADAVNPARY